jgi:hypothetical protein
MVLQVLPLLIVLAGGSGPGAEPRRARLSAAEEATRLLSDPQRRVRATDARIAGLIEQGVRRSYSFADLVRSLHETDVIVYIEVTADLPRAVNGHLFLVSSRDNQRYLRIQVRTGLHPDETIALLAHELRHALEVGSDPTVTTAAEFALLYARIGHNVSGLSRRYDTAAAQEMGRVVRRELGG